MVGKKLLLFFAISFVLSSCGDSVEQKKVSVSETMSKTQNNEIINKAKLIVKKYSMKSGMITYKNSGSLGESKAIVYFDDFGIKERKEEYNSKGELEEVKFTDGKNMYVINPNGDYSKVAFIMGSGVMGTEMKFDPAPFKSNKSKERNGYERLDKREILGKRCEAYSAKNNMGKSMFAGWNGILLYSKVIVKNDAYETIAVEFKENINIEEALFKVPDGYTVQKL